MQNYLMNFKNVRDVRELNEKSLKVVEFEKYNDAIQMLQCLFPEYVPQ